MVSLAILFAAASLLVGAVAIAKPRPKPKHKPKGPPSALNFAFGSRGVTALGKGYQLLGVATQPNGKVVVAGDQQLRSGVRLVVARLTSAGRLDRSFNRGHVQLGPKERAGGSIGNAVAIQRDGKILVAGVVTDRTGTAQGGMLVVRFTSTGALDRRFGSGGTTVLGGTAGGAANGLALQRDGKMLLAGSALGTDGLPRIALARLDTRGRPDHSFAANGISVAQGSQDLGRDGTADAVAVQPGGGIVVAGSARPNLQSQNAVLARFNSRGSLDTSFGSGGSFVVPANVEGGGAVLWQSLAVVGNGEIVAAGSAASSGHTPAYAIAARLSGNGQPIGSFGRKGIVALASQIGSVTVNPIPGATGVAIARRGTIVLAGAFVDSGQSEVSLWSLNGRGAIVRSGTVRTKLSKSLSSGGANALAIDSQGRIVVAGTSNNFISFNGVVLRYNGFGR